jgi:hypothetical protein
VVYCLCSKEHHSWDYARELQPLSRPNYDSIAAWGRNFEFRKGEQTLMRKVLMICFALCFVFAMYAMAADDMGKSSTVKGWVADDKCGAKGANAKAEACTKKCLESGAKMVVVTDGDQKILMVDNPESLKGHEGHHVAVTGTVKGDSIHVDSAKML